VKSITEDSDGRRTADIDNILIVKKQGGSVSETSLIDGIILDKERVHEGMPRSLDNAKSRFWMRLSSSRRLKLTQG